MENNPLFVMLIGIGVVLELVGIILLIGSIFPGVGLWGL